MEEFFLARFDKILKDVESMREEYFTEGMQFMFLTTIDKPEPKEEVHSSVLRTAHLSRYAMVQTTQKAGFFTNTFQNDREKFDILKGIEEASLEILNKKLPDNKVRPSLLQPLCNGLAVVGAASVAILGEERSYKLFKVMEDTIQQEHDQMLRKLNEHEIEDKETRKLLTSTRDIGYDYFDQHHKDIDKNEEHEDNIEKYMKTATKFITLGLLKASERI